MNRISAPDSDEIASRVALVISSCDDFCDAWQPFVHFFVKFWPDCPFRAFFILNELPVVSDVLEPIAVGPDRGWSSNFRRALESISHEHILYLQDDYFLTRPVETQRILEDCAWCLANGYDSLCFRGYAEPQPGFTPLTSRFGLAPLDSDGRTRCQFALWKKSALLEILREGETAWDMESRGSGRTLDMRILVYARKADAPIQYLSSAIVRGLWTEAALELCRTDGVRIDPPWRGVYRKGQQFKKIRRAVSRVLLKLALGLRRGRAIDLRKGAAR